MTIAAAVNVCFHGIGTPGRQLEVGEEHYWISPRLYDEILDEVGGHPEVHLSFDDGNRSDVDVALEGLLSRGMTATFFALAGRLDNPGSLNADDLRALRQHGMTIGTHGMRHRPWRGMDEQTQRLELVEAREILAEASDGPVDEAALPLGRYDRKVLGALRSQGYQAVYTSDRRPARRGAWIQPRYSVRAGDTIEAVRSTVLRPPSILRRAKAEAVGVIKRLR
ncbi:MAG: polysaccharide deacetylase family protein [Microbacteriaceae bacterium]